MAKVERSRALTPIGSAPSASARAELARVVGLHERVEALVGGGLHQPPAGIVVEVAQEEQDRVGAGLGRRPRVLLGREEALGEQRHGRGPPRCPHVVPAAAEALGVDEDRDRSGACLLVGRRDSRRIRVRAQVAGRRRAALDLGDRRQPAPGQGSAEAPHQPPRPPPGGPALDPADPPARIRTSSSSRCPADPESTASVGQGEPVAQVVRAPGGGDRRGSVQQHRVSPRAVGAREDLSNRGRVGFRRAAREVGRSAARDPELQRVDEPLTGLSARHLPDEVRPRRGQLVDAVGAVDDEGALGAELEEHLREGRRELGRVDPHDLRASPGRVRQRPEHVEHGPRRELAADGGRMAHGGVVEGGEQKPEAELVDRALDALRRQLELESERLEDVRRAGGRRHRAVAVLRDSGAGCGGDERGRGRDVERVRAVSPRARGVDEILPLRLHGEHVRAHRLGAACDLVRRLALEPERDEEGAHLGRRRLAVHDLVHDGPRLRPGQVAAVEEARERELDHRSPSRKRRPISGPSGVSTDSGWNWMPTTGCSRCRTAITSPSSVVAHTSSESGTRVAAREW